jgi:hypothetical protein
MRAADRDRERVVHLLSIASGEGRLSLEEFEERSVRAYAAKTYGDLDRLVEDLPEGWQADTSVPAHPEAGEVESSSGAILGGWLPSNARLVEMTMGPFHSRNRRRR